MSAQGWDKTYCLQFLTKEFDTIHFFGDKTFEVSVLQCCSAAVIAHLLAI